MTVSDMPLASDTPESVVDRARVLARARARLAVTFGDVKGLHTAGRFWSVAAADARRWWLVAAQPPSLTGWLAGQRPAERRVPAGNGLLRGLWVVDNWTTGLATNIASIVLFLAAGGLRWLAGHPLRRWAFFILAAALMTWVALT